MKTATPSVDREWLPTRDLPPEGKVVETKAYPFSQPVDLWREGGAWFRSMKGGGRFQTNYSPMFWREKE